MAQAVADGRRGGGGRHGRPLLGREPAPLAEAIGEVLSREGIELVLSANASAARREGEDYLLELDDGRELRGDRLLVATGRRPRVQGIGLETVGVEPDAHGVPVDAHLRAADGLWAVGDVTGIWQLTHVGKYQGDVAAANILGEPRKANYEAVPRVTYTDPQAAAVGAAAGRCSAMVPVSGVAKTATYTRAYAESNWLVSALALRSLPAPAEDGHPMALAARGGSGGLHQAKPTVEDVRTTPGISSRVDHKRMAAVQTRATTMAKAISNGPMPNRRPCSPRGVPRPNA